MHYGNHSSNFFHTFRLRTFSFLISSVNHGAPGRWRSRRGFGAGTAFGSISSTDTAPGHIASMYLNTPHCHTHQSASTQSQVSADMYQGSVLRHRESRHGKRKGRWAMHRKLPQWASKTERWLQTHSSEILDMKTFTAFHSTKEELKL